MPEVERGLTYTYESIIIRIMKTKLTLSVDSKAVTQAKRMAKRKGVSVSALFEQWSTRMAEMPASIPLGKRLRGRWKDTAASTGDARLEYLMEKHTRP